MGVDDGSPPMGSLAAIALAASASLATSPPGPTPRGRLEPLKSFSDARYLARLSPGECKASWAAVFGRVQSNLMRT